MMKAMKVLAATSVLFLINVGVYAQPIQSPGPQVQSAEDRLKAHLGELLFSNTMLAAENDRLKMQNLSLSRANQELREKYEPKSLQPGPQQ